jgi:hypothetical protein
MSDYLTRLVERSLGVVPQIEPLIAPLHAPAGQSLSLATEPIARIAPAAGAESDVAQGDTAPVDAPNATTSTPAAIPSLETQTPRRERRSSELPARSDSEKYAGSGESKRLAPETQTPETLHPVSLSLPPSKKSPENRTTADPQPVIAVPAGAGVAAPNSPEPARKAAKALPGPQRVVVQPQVTAPRRSPPAFPPLSRQQGRNEPPAIHVTIGRVEVRAVMPPPTPPRPAAPPPAAPKLSLEEYLKQRNGARS